MVTLPPTAAPPFNTKAPSVLLPNGFVVPLDNTKLPAMLVVLRTFNVVNLPEDATLAPIGKLSA